MIGCYDYCGHYDWTFGWLQREGTRELVHEYWAKAISVDSRRHTRALIAAEGIEGMRKYWGQVLDEEAAGYAITAEERSFRIDMHACPSKGFLLRNGLENFEDYCDHCIGWIGPVMRDAGYVIDHQHNHCGQCWWVMRRKEDAAAPLPPGAPNDVRHLPGWSQPGTDTFVGATGVTGKRKTDPS